MYLNVRQCTIIGHLLGHPGYSATSVFKDQYVRELRNHVLEYLDDRSRKRHTKAHLLMMMPHWDMTWSRGWQCVLGLGMFAKELMWPDMVKVLIDAGSFPPLPRNILPACFRLTTRHILFDYSCFTTSNILSLLAKVLDGLLTPLNQGGSGTGKSDPVWKGM